MKRLFPLKAPGINREIIFFFFSGQLKAPARFVLIVTAIIFSLFGFLSTEVSAQTLPFATVGNTGVFSDTSTLVEEKLVELALKGPQYNVSGYQKKITEQQLAKAKISWLNLLTISLNYNDQTFAKTSNTPYVYPKYYFGLTIPVGTIFTVGPDIKVAKENVKVAKANQDQLSRVIKADVLSKYKQYKTYNQLIAIQSIVINDEQAALAQAEKKFGNGDISIELYNATSKRNNEELSKLINLQLQRELTKIEIEKVIGVSLESAIEEALQPPTVVPEKPR